ncbi:MAG: Gfo/Idh/MocA family oxidoreductase [Clostridia bacterium]|nr:Gfo/Idh/MocA family oxidoreductase [Clostridia bacterium]
MFRIGILGTENSHAAVFTDIFNAGNDFPDCKVVAVGGHYPEASQKIFEKHNLEFIAEKPEDLLGKVDAVMVTARDGKYHAEFVRPFLEAGIPAFIDKPITIDPAEALSLARLSKEKNVPIYGGSSLKCVYDVVMLQNVVKQQWGGVHGGSVYAPLSMVNEYGGFYFYTAHLAEMSMTIFGYDPQSVYAFRCGDDVTAVVRYDRYTVTNHFMEGCNRSYFGMVSCKDRNFAREVDISLCYKHECEEFVSMLRTGKAPRDLREIILPVYYLNAIEKSYNTGKEVAIEMPEI